MTNWWVTDGRNESGIGDVDDNDDDDDDHDDHDDDNDDDSGVMPKF